MVRTLFPQSYSTPSMQHYQFLFKIISLKNEFGLEVGAVKVYALHALTLFILQQKEL